MKFFVDNQEVEKKVKTILAKIRMHMNGATSAQMHKMGIVYRTNYGVGQPHIKAIAAQYEKDFDLADRLWHREERECMLLALQLAPADSMSLSQVKEWVPLVTNIELVEHSAMSLFSKLPFAMELVDCCLEHENEMSNALAYYILAWKLQNDLIDLASEVEIVMASHFSSSDDGYILAKSKAFLARKYIRKTMHSHSAISDLTSVLKLNADAYIQRLAIDIDTELDFVKHQA